MNNKKRRLENHKIKQNKMLIRSYSMKIILQNEFKLEEENVNEMHIKQSTVHFN